MATLKQCDLCKSIWNPTDTRDSWVEEDRNRCSISVTAPRDTSNWKRNVELSYTHECCQDCARAVHEFLEERKPKNG